MFKIGSFFVKNQPFDCTTFVWKSKLCIPIIIEYHLYTKVNPTWTLCHSLALLSWLGVMSSTTWVTSSTIRSACVRSASVPTPVRTPKKKTFLISYETFLWTIAQKKVFMIRFKGLLIKYYWRFILLMKMWMLGAFLNKSKLLYIFG